MERGDSVSESQKRKIDEEIELAKQRAQEIASRLVNSAESKRPRLEIAPSQFSSSYPPQAPLTPPPPATATQFHGQFNSLQGSSKRISIPNAKVGVIIGRGGDMIKNLQLRSGARIQITRDADADPTSLTRDVELVGTQEQISRAEELINEVIAETDAASAGSTGNRSGGGMVHAGGEQIILKVPNDKVALIIGKGGETIKSMQIKTGARIQVVPLHLPPGDTSLERSIHIGGSKEQIDSAKELINEIVNGQNRLKTSSGSTGYTQTAYAASGGWASQGQVPPVQQQASYGYGQQGTYAAPPYYGGYPSSQPGWDQTNPSALPPPAQQNASYNMYGQQTQPTQPTSTQPNVSYNYNQMPPASGYTYNQGYPQQPTYGQDYTAQAPPSVDQQNPYANPAYGASVTSSQPDASTTIQVSQPGYAAPVAASQTDNTTQSQPAATYASGYNQPSTTPANGYGTYPGSGYATQPPAQVAYNQTSYPQTGYGQPQGVQVSTQASQSYYGQSGYALPPPSAQPNYYQAAYPPPVAGQQQMQPPPTLPLPANGTSQPPNYPTEKAADGKANGPGGVVQDADNSKS